MAFGEQIGEEKGTVTAFRVVKDGFGVKVESQFQGQGTMLGVPFVDYATYVSVYRPDGNFTGTADGVIFTQEAEAASYTGTGVGHMLGTGGCGLLARRPLLLQRVPALRPAELDRGAVRVRDRRQRARHGDQVLRVEVARPEVAERGPGGTRLASSAAPRRLSES